MYVKKTPLNQQINYKTKLMITIQQSATSHKAQFNYDNFVFGIQPTDHIFLCEYQSGEWLSPRIVPYHNLTISPLAMCLHYGQTVFEGMKAFRQKMVG